MAKAEIEILSAIVRVWENEDSGYGEPYDFISTIRFIDRETIEVCGAIEAPKLSYCKAIKKCMEELGVKEIIFVRIIDGKKKTKTLRV